LYELIQNAEDNSYSKASREGELPFLHFSIYSNAIHVDSNEDGFLEEHVVAICSIGDSSKQNAAGYIGEKGIGFKSIFKVAQKVHIQSGCFSFSFTYTQSADEDGLGMVTPYEEPHLENVPANVRTRFIITPRNDSTFEKRVADFENLPETFLLFLNKLKMIKISVYPPNGLTKTTSYSTVQSDSNLETIIKTTSDGSNTTRQKHKFHVTRRKVDNLPKDSARSEINTATVVLAFPVDAGFNPLELQQYTFAYLPVRNLGFKVGFYDRATFICN